MNLSPNFKHFSETSASDQINYFKLNFKFRFQLRYFVLINNRIIFIEIHCFISDIKFIPIEIKIYFYNLYLIRLSVDQ